MSEKIAKCAVKREKGYLYFIDQNGNVARTKMARGKGAAVSPIEVVAKTQVKKEKGYLYFLDKDGDVSKAVMSRRGRK